MHIFFSWQILLFGWFHGIWNHISSWGKYCQIEVFYFTILDKFTESCFWWAGSLEVENWGVPLWMRVLVVLGRVGCCGAAKLTTVAWLLSTSKTFFIPNAMMSNILPCMPHMVRESGWSGSMPENGSVRKILESRMVQYLTIIFLSFVGDILFYTEPI